MTGESLSDRKDHDPYELYPNPEDWTFLQGGKPRVFFNPYRPKGVWKVLHVYDEHPHAKERFLGGEIVDTIPPETTDIPVSRLSFTRKDETGVHVQREVQVPSFMLINLHGGPCEERSDAAGGGEYKRVKTQREYADFIVKMRKAGMQELRYGVQDGALKLIPVQEIRDPRPLEIQPTEAVQEPQQDPNPVDNPDIIVL